MPSALWTWCFKARKTLFLRREAPRRPVRPALRSRGRGASRPAKPYSFVGGHHVPELVRAFGAVDVVLQGPQSLIPSSGGTTSLSPSVPSAPWTWCFKARKSLFFRREAPRRPVRPALRRRGRGASRPENPYSFVGRHHAARFVRPFGAVDVVLQGPKILIPSSGGTTPPGSAGPSAPWTWCFKARKTLFLRREAPRRPVRPALRSRGRGASRPAKPYSFVGGHHVPELVRAFGAVDVVLQGPQTLFLSSGSTTSLSPSVLSAPWTWCFKARKTLFLRREAPRP